MSKKKKRKEKEKVFLGLSFLEQMCINSPEMQLCALSKVWTIFEQCNTTKFIILLHWQR